MTKRDFFRILIKVFGLYSLITTVFYFFPSNIGYLLTDFSPLIILGSLVSIGILVIFCILLIRGADKIIDFFKLDKGFDDARIEIGNFNNYMIMKFALIIIGGFLIIDYIPDFIQYCFLTFKNKVSTQSKYLTDFGYGIVEPFQWAVSTISIIVGYILITNYNKIASWILKKEQKNE